MPRALPLVALVGRPNVGKSTLFNRIIGERRAIVEDRPGTTRDRHYGQAEWNGKAFSIVDTGGLEVDDRGPFSSRIRNQVGVALDEAAVIVFVTDAMTGVTADDEDVARLLRQTQKPVVLTVSKTERKENLQATSEFWQLGLGEPIPVSGIHGSGTGDLLDAVAAALPDLLELPEEDDRLGVAVIGRPNVGKSSLLNRLLGEERMIVSEIPGTTRDAVDTVLHYQGEEIVLIDTAGIRRRGKVEPGIEKYAVLRADRAIERADVVVLVIDAADGVTAQDAHIGGLIAEAGKGAIIAVNKWDLIDKEAVTFEDYVKQVRGELKFLEFAPVLTLSALTGQRATKVLDLAREVDAARKVRVPTGELNRFLLELQAGHSFSRRGRELKFRYVTQVDIEPPTFIFFVNEPELVHFATERMLINRLRERYGFVGTPLKLVFRSSSQEK
ncbi:MAG: ribosome biogenesis GTPase Der [Ardenticatenia bacterium]|nr:ribosome biogenesis GTPase Der [Ardenticatenia bacterium]